MLGGLVLGLLPVALGAVWQPPAGTTYQIVLKNITGTVPFDDNGKCVPNVDVYALDLFDTPVDLIKTLHGKGKKVVCYFSAGTHEDWRTDLGGLQKEDIGKDLPDWKGERYVDIRSERVRDVMKKRIALAAEKGCDAVDPDNVDVYDNENGLKDITQEDSVDYVKFMASEAAMLNVSIGLKNAPHIIPDVLPVVQFAMQEECVQQKNCDKWLPFIDAGKPVFNMEYPSEALSLNGDQLTSSCASPANFSTIIKTLDLVTWVEYCDGSVYGTALPEEKPSTGLRTAGADTIGATLAATVSVLFLGLLTGF